MLGDGSIQVRPVESNQSPRCQFFILTTCRSAFQFAFRIGHGGEFAQRQAVPHGHVVAADEALQILVEHRTFDVRRPVTGFGRSST